MVQLEADMAAVEVRAIRGKRSCEPDLAERKMMKGVVFAANTLDELATLLGYEGEAAQRFVESIEHYNELCHSVDGDTDFGKDSAYMLPIETPPFYGK